jgi:hypothetical protein
VPFHTEPANEPRDGMTVLVIHRLCPLLLT